MWFSYPTTENSAPSTQDLIAMSPIRRSVPAIVSRSSMPTPRSSLPEASRYLFPANWMPPHTHKNAIPSSAADRIAGAFSARSTAMRF